MVTLNDEDIYMVQNDTHAVFQWANDTIVIRRSTHSPERWWCLTPSPGDFDPAGDTPQKCRDVYIKQWKQEVQWSQDNKEAELERLTTVLNNVTTKDKYSIL